MRSWLLMSYKIPREPTSRRVYVWRKLRRLGALLLHDAVWVLPDNDRALEQFQWLATEIEEFGGEVTLWRGHLALNGQDDALVKQFLAQVEGAYAQILAELDGKDPDLASLSRRFQQVSLSDYFHSDLGQRVRDALLAARGGQN